MTDFELFIKINNLKKKDIATYLNVSGAFITQLVQGVRSIPDDKLALIKANDKWDVSMFKSSFPAINETPQRNWTPAPNYACESGSVYERIRDLEENLRLNELAIKEKDAQIKRQEDLINKLFDLVKKLNDK